MSERVFDYVAHLHEDYRTYHNHKETLAYNGMALYVAAFGIALASKDWPPAWATKDHLLGFWAVSAAWLLFLMFIKWQLRNRRWAALRAAGADRVLARWATASPTAEELAVPDAKDLKKPPRWKGAVVQVVDHVWPLRAAVSAVDVSQAVYPKALVEAWLEQAKDRGTNAIVNERLFIVAGWCLYLALVARTVSATPLSQ